MRSLWIFNPTDKTVAALDMLRADWMEDHEPGTPDCPALPAAGWCPIPGHQEFDLADHYKEA